MALTTGDRRERLVSPRREVQACTKCSLVTASALGGYKAQGKTAQSAIQLCEDALAPRAVGCFAIVFEAVPAAITEAIVEKLEISVIGMVAGMNRYVDEVRPLPRTRPRLRHRTRRALRVQALPRPGEPHFR